MAELDPKATTTEDGAVSKLLTVDTATVAPPAGAFVVIVTVHVLEADGPNVAGLQASAETVSGAVRLMAALAEPPL